MDNRDAQALFASLPLDRLPAPTPTLPPHSRMAFGRNPQFVGRERDLLNLALAIADPQPTIIVSAVTTGMGGIGKTSLAVEFVYRYGGYFAGGVFWLNCAEPTAIPGEVAACAAPLGLPVAGLPLNEQVAAVRRAWQEATPRLLIFDNAEDPGIPNEWMPTIGGCRVLVTTRRREWPGMYRVPIGIFSRTESVELLQRLAHHLAPEDAQMIAETLGDLPLALHLAGSYLARVKDHETPTQYVNRLRTIDLLDHPAFKGRALRTGESLPTRHEQDVGRTFALSLDQLAPTDPIDALARNILAGLSYLAPGELVSYSLVQKLLPERTDILDGLEALDRTIALGLVEQETDRAIRVHRLVHRFLGRALSDPHMETLVENGLLALSAEARSTGATHVVASLIAHFQWRSDTAVAPSDASMATLLNSGAGLLRALGNYALARLWYERALIIRETVLGTEHPDTVAILGNLGSVLQSLGDYAAARLRYEQALAINKRTVGWDHPATGTSLSNLAVLLTTLGDYSAAQQLYEQALAITKAALGDDHPDTAAILNRLARLLGNQGRHDAAEPLAQYALALREQQFGTMNPATAQSLETMAGILRARGLTSEAEHLARRALLIAESILGAHHPDTATSLHNLAYLLSMQERTTEAEPLYQRALAIREAVLGADHPDVATILTNLAGLLLAQRRFSEAEVAARRAVMIREMRLPPDHPDCATSLNALAETLAAQGRMLPAIMLFRQALEIREKALGTAHPYAQMIRDRIAAVEIETLIEP